jgi:hypothetical protein
LLPPEQQLKEVIIDPVMTKQDSIDKYLGGHPTEEDYDAVYESPVIIKTSSGGIVGIVVDNATKNTKTAFEVLSKAVGPTRNRQIAAAGHTSYVKKKDGTMSKTTQLPTHLAPLSSIVGYMDRYARTPYARPCSWNRDNAEEWRKVIPFVRSVAECYKKYAPEKWSVQRAHALQVPPEWVIADTPFSTITLNKNFSINYHQDAGDLAEGLGVMAHLSIGNYHGGELVLPRYRVAFKLKNRDVAMFDSHEVHGVVPLGGGWGRFSRFTFVFYLREKLLRCGTAEHEINRGKRSRHIGHLYDEEELVMEKHRRERAHKLAPTLLQ